LLGIHWQNYDERTPHNSGSRIIIITIWLSIWVINTVQTTYGIETNTGLKHAEMYKAKAQSQNTTVATTNDNKKNTNLTDWLTAIGTISSAIGAVGIAGYSFYLTRRNEQKHSLAYVLRLLNDNANRNARRRIYNLYGEDDHRGIDYFYSYVHCVPVCSGEYRGRSINLSAVHLELLYTYIFVIS
jgi:hypothetical protein